MELWAGNERAQRALELAGLEADVIAVPSGCDAGGDLSAVFSCSDNIARVVLADCVGHGTRRAWWRGTFTSFCTSFTTFAIPLVCWRH